MNIAVFGGTFDPPHKAHLNIARDFALRLPDCKVMVIPTFVPPHKVRDNLAKSEDRLNMCRLLFNEDFFEVSDIEIKREGKSFSYDTLCELKRLYPNDKLHFIIGSDMLLSFDKWYRYRDILSMCTLCVMTREGDIDTKTMLSYAKDVLSLSENEIVISPCAAYEMSSTLIREKIKNGEDVSYYLTEEVIMYIKEKGLYVA